MQGELSLFRHHYPRISPVNRVVVKGESLLCCQRTNVMMFFCVLMYAIIVLVSLTRLHKYTSFFTNAVPKNYSHFIPTIKIPAMPSYIRLCGDNMLAAKNTTMVNKRLRKRRGKVRVVQNETERRKATRVNTFHTFIQSIFYQFIFIQSGVAVQCIR